MDFHRENTEKSTVDLDIFLTYSIHSKNQRIVKGKVLTAFRTLVLVGVTTRVFLRQSEQLSTFDLAKSIQSILPQVMSQNTSHSTKILFITVSFKVKENLAYVSSL